MSEQLDLLSSLPSISSAEVSPARTSAQPEKAPGSVGADLAYFGSYSVSFARWSPDGWSSKMSPLFEREDAERYSGRWPASGMVLPPVAGCVGAAYPQPRWVLLIDGRGGFVWGGRWPTPNASLINYSESVEDYDKRQLAQGRINGGALEVEVRRVWPTPDAGLFNMSESPESFDARRARLKEKGINGNGAGSVLAVEVKRWPTPAAQDHKNNSLPPSQGERDTLPGEIIRSAAKGYLNPSWVEALMGFPENWTAITGGPLRQDHSIHGNPPEPDHASPTTETD